MGIRKEVMLFARFVSHFANVQTIIAHERKKCLYLWLQDGSRMVLNECVEAWPPNRVGYRAAFGWRVGGLRDCAHPLDRGRFFGRCCVAFMVFSAGTLSAR